jgi:hypothetical protein
MNIHLRTIGSGIVIGIMVLVSIPFPSLAAQKDHRHHATHLSVQPRSHGYGSAPAPARKPVPLTPPSQAPSDR